MRGGGVRLLRKAGAGRLHLVEAVGGDQRREDRHDEEQDDDGRPGVEQPLRGSLSLPDLPHEAPGAGQPPGTGWGGGARLRHCCRVGGHQYLTRGSMKAFARSMRSETSTTASAKTVMMPCTAM